MKIGLLLPSRGLLYSEVLQAVCRELGSIPSQWFLTHSKPIPQCFTELGDRLLLSDCTHGWFVEEDVVVPEGALAALLQEDKDITAIHYPLHQRGQWVPPPARFTDAGLARGQVDRRLVWVGLGCTMVHRRVFEQLPRPWFRTDRQLISVHSGSSSNGRSLKLCPVRPRYGRQDLYFSSKATMAGFTVGEVRGMLAKHLDSVGDEKATYSQSHARQPVQKRAMAG